jgi:hypothetical protein
VGRPDLEALRARLMAAGASAVVTTDELDSPVVRDAVLARLGRPRIALGLNAVGGPATTALLKWLAYVPPPHPRTRTHRGSACTKPSARTYTHACTQTYAVHTMAPSPSCLVPWPCLWASSRASPTDADAGAGHSPGAVLVTYGGMAKQPVTVPVSALIFRDVALRGFWMTRWNQTQAAEARAAMLADLVGMEQAGTLRAPPLRRWPLQAYADAIAAAQQPYQEHKPLLMLSDTSD